MQNLSGCDSLIFLEAGPAVVDWVSRDVARWLMLGVDIVTAEGQDVGRDTETLMTAMMATTPTTEREGGGSG